MCLRGYRTSLALAVCLLLIGASLDSRAAEPEAPKKATAKKSEGGGPLGWLQGLLQRGRQEVRRAEARARQEELAQQQVLAKKRQKELEERIAQMKQEMEKAAEKAISERHKRVELLQEMATLKARAEAEARFAADLRKEKAELKKQVVDLKRNLEQARKATIVADLRKEKMELEKQVLDLKRNLEAARKEIVDTAKIAASARERQLELAEETIGALKEALKSTRAAEEAREAVRAAKVRAEVEAATRAAEAKARRKAEAAKKRAEQLLKQVQQIEYARRIELAQQELKSAKLKSARELLEKEQPKPGKKE
jgi:hypothetical protein